LAAALRSEFSAERLEVICADALSIELGSLGERLRIAGNLPYHVSSPLLFHCARHAMSVRDLHFMLQAEVVERMAAAPDTPDYGRVSGSLHSVFAVGRRVRLPAVT